MVTPSDHYSEIFSFSERIFQRNLESSICMCFTSGPRTIWFSIKPLQGTAGAESWTGTEPGTGDEVGTEHEPRTGAEPGTGDEVGTGAEPPPRPRSLKPWPELRLSQALQCLCQALPTQSSTISVYLHSYTHNNIEHEPTQHLFCLKILQLLSNTIQRSKYFPGFLSLVQ